MSSPSRYHPACQSSCYSHFSTEIHKDLESQPIRFSLVNTITCVKKGCLTSWRVFAEVVRRTSCNCDIMTVRVFYYDTDSDNMDDGAGYRRSLLLCLSTARCFTMLQLVLETSLRRCRFSRRVRIQHAEVGDHRMLLAACTYSTVDSCGATWRIKSIPQRVLKCESVEDLRAV